MGPRPEKYNLLKRKMKKQEGKIVLIHGYCASGNPFSTTNFQNFIVFSDPQANRGTDAFFFKS